MIAKTDRSKDTITTDEFGYRLAELCLRRGGGGLPRKRRDQHILLKSVALTLDPDHLYGEPELNQRLQSWLEQVGRAVQIDHVSLRRCLVDEGYVVRDRAGTTYSPSAEAHAEMFAADIDTLDPAETINNAIRERKARKRQYLKAHPRADG